MPLLKPQQVLEYGSGQGHTWSGFYKTDRNTETNECYNRYSSKKFYFDPSNPYKAISGMNIEHSFPKSWWGGAKNNAYKDLYHLYPSDKDANSSKSNYPMDEVKNVTSEDEGYDKVGTGVHTGGKAWEPGDRFKGDFARTYMYMAVAYGDLTFSETGQQTMNNEDYPGLKPWASTLYIAWNKTDSVSTLELDRNNAIAAIEGNRNLFIDYPNLAEYVWGDSVDVAFDPYTSITTASDDDRYSNSVSPDEPGGDTEKYYFVAATTVTSGKQYLVVAKDGNTLYAMAPLGSSQKFGYPKADKVKEVSDTIRTTALTDALHVHPGRQRLHYRRRHRPLSLARGFVQDHQREHRRKQCSHMDADCQCRRNIQDSHRCRLLHPVLHEVHVLRMLQLGAGAHADALRAGGKGRHTGCHHGHHEQQEDRRRTHLQPSGSVCGYRRERSPARNLHPQRPEDCREITKFICRTAEWLP